MNEGQMIIQLPLGASFAPPMAACSTGTPASAGSADKSEFSGVLRCVSPDTSNGLPQSVLIQQPVSPEPSETAVTDLLMLQAGSLSAAMTTLSTEDTEALQDDAEHLKPTEQQQEQNPQNVETIRGCTR